MIGTLCLTCWTVHAKVFRWGQKAPDELNNGSLPWDNAYRVNMTVNGKPTRMHVYSARHSEPVLHQLTTRFEALGARVRATRSQDGATGVAQWPDRSASFIILSPDNEPNQTVMVYFPDPDARVEQVTFPVPEYTRAKRVTTISDDDTATFMATSETSDSATEIHDYYLRSMKGDGWELRSPALVKNGTVSGMAVYQKGKKICYVQAVDRQGRPNMVTLLVKGGAL
jgi:hypothetical protein